jgi:hypothetical protein
MAIYGSLNPKLVRDDIDLVGIRHLEVAQMWQPAQAALSITNVLALRPEPPSFPNMELIADSVIPRDGGMESMWTFEGYSDDPALTFKTYGVSTQWDFEPGFQECSLLFHPSWQTIEDNYGGTVDADNTITWPPFLTGQTGTGLAAASDSQQLTPNPMYGYQTYYSMGTGAWTYRWADIEFNPAFYQQVGEIVPASSIPGNPPTFSSLGKGTRSWLKLPPKHRRRGAIYEFVGAWWLSTDGGWPTPVYSTAGASTTLNNGEQPGSAGGGL